MEERQRGVWVGRRRVLSTLMSRPTSQSLQQCLCYTALDRYREMLGIWCTGYSRGGLLWL